MHVCTSLIIRSRSFSFVSSLEINTAYILTMVVAQLLIMFKSKYSISIYRVSLKDSSGFKQLYIR
jgi:hypothetical protein